MEHGGIELHTVTVYLIRGGTDVELLLHRKHYYIPGGRIVCAVLLTVGLNGTEPGLLTYHVVEGLVLVHAVSVA